MNTSPINEFPVTVQCPKSFKKYPVWVRELSTNGKRLFHVNGCDNCSGDDSCQACCAAVFRKVTQDR